MSTPHSSSNLFLIEALALAKEAAGDDEVPVGAVVVFEDRIIGRGRNKREKENNPLAHAEMIALADASKNLKSWRLLGCTLFVTLEPCPMCLSACQQARVKKVVYGAKDEKGGALCLGFHVHQDARLNHQFEVEYVPEEQCGEVLSNFFKKKRNKNN